MLQNLLKNSFSYTEKIIWNEAEKFKYVLIGKREKYKEFLTAVGFRLREPRLREPMEGFIIVYMVP